MLGWAGAVANSDLSARQIPRWLLLLGFPLVIGLGWSAQFLTIVTIGGVLLIGGMLVIQATIERHLGKKRLVIGPGDTIVFPILAISGIFGTMSVLLALIATGTLILARRSNSRFSRVPFAGLATGIFLLVHGIFFTFAA